MAHIRTRSNISEIRNSLANVEIGPGDIIDIYTKIIEQQNPILNACITVLHPKESEIDLGQSLAGIPIVLKDLFETKGIATTAGAEFLRNNFPMEDATVVTILKEAGAIILAKTNMHEVALGVTNINPHYGTCRNPWDIRHISGGSSGGSAVAVASGMCVAALGSDTGGSIRIPSSLCGTVGLKPTYGRISLHGVIPLSWNLDHVGPITNNVRDAAIILQTLAGYDPLDPASIDYLVDDYLSRMEDGVKGWRIAFAKGDYIDESQAEVVSSLNDAFKVFYDLGAKVEEVNVPWLHEGALANGIMTQADAAAYHQERLFLHPQEFGEDVLVRLRTGMAYTSSEYSQARHVQTICKRKFKQLFEDYDLLILPTTPSTAPMIEGLDAIDQARKLTRFTAPFNLAGLPAMSLPCGFSQAGLPIGLQFVGAEWEEAKVLRAGRAFEESTEWHERIPPLQI
jgi:aspartyl-tRNA(Asn)/glutamyl-tRNA(Gln) amidotransferase subunit A